MFAVITESTICDENNDFTIHLSTRVLNKPFPSSFALIEPDYESETKLKDFPIKVVLFA